MKKHFLSYLIFLLASLMGCNRMEAQKALSFKPYISILEDGLTKKFDYLWVPQGRITIMDKLRSTYTPANVQSMIFQYKTLKDLQDSQNDGLVNLSEEKQSPLLDTSGNRIFVVTPNEKIRQMADPKESNQKWIAILLGTMKVLKIIKEEPCKLKRATPGDEFLLVVGLLRDPPTQNVKTLGPEYGTVEPRELKFRAILQLNPFNQSYKFIIADTGMLNETEWKSDWVAQIILEGNQSQEQDEE